ncbi:MAG: hypothetical protein AAFV47_03185 [Pseudomonadota bacterium]
MILSAGMQRTLSAALALSYASFLVIVYVGFVAPVFAYMGFSAENIDLSKCVEAFVLILILSLTVAHRFEKPSDFLVFCLFFLTVLPVLLLMGLMDKSRVVAITIVLAYLLVWAINRLPAIRLPVLIGGRRMFWVLSVSMTVLTVAWVFVSGAASGFSLDLATIYDSRGSQGDKLQVGVLAYLNQWVFKSINPLLVVFAAVSRRWLILVGLLALQVFFFGVTAHKSIAAIALLVLGTYTLLQRDMKPYQLIAMAATSVTGVYAMALAYGLIAPASYLVRRAVFVPADLHYAYFEFFGQAGHVRWSSSILSSFVHYPFDYPTPNTMSVYLYGHAEAAANAGFLAAGFMHFGYLGVGLFALIMGILLRVIDGLALRTGMPLAVAAVLPGYLWAITSSDLTTSLLTHGLLFSLFLLWLLSSEISSATVTADERSS